MAAHLKLKIILSSFIIVLILILLLTPTREALVFQFQNSGHVLAYIPISKGDTFEIKYTHSIHLSDVIDSYTVTNEGQIKQYELVYEDFAIGMPSNASDGEIFQQENGKYYLKNMNRVFPYFDLRVGKVRANHTLIYKQIEYPLSRCIEPGSWVRLKVERINLWQQWKGVNILG